MTRRTTWRIDMGDGTWAVCCTACRIALYRGPKAGADGRPSSRPTPGPGAAARPRTPPVDGRAAHRQPPPKEQSVPSMYRTRHPGGAPPPGWSLPPAWGQPLNDPLPLQAGGPVGRWLWPALAVAGFLVVTGFVLGHDDPAPGLSGRGLLTIAVAAVVVVLLTIHRAAGPGPLARALFEYAVVFGLAMLLATTGVDLDQAPGGNQANSATRDQRPALVKVIDGFGDWLREWRTWASTETDRRAHSSATSPAPPLPSSTRRLL